MTKILIRNRVEPNWRLVIEAKLHLILGSMLASISRLDLDFDRTVKQRDNQVTYGCKIVMTRSNGERYLQLSAQPDANLAIEGAIARARRAVTRLGRARVSAWGQTSIH